MTNNILYNTICRFKLSTFMGTEGRTWRDLANDPDHE